MAETATRHTVRCPDCRRERQVGFYGLRTIRRGDSSGRCRECAYRVLGATRAAAAAQRFGARFQEKVEKTDGCWLWRPAKPNEYGKFMVRKGVMDGAHRVAWTLAHGPIPKGLMVLHRCDNPRCVRPDHLFLGTAADNSRDMVAKGRYYSPRKSRCKHGHSFDAENTYVDRKGRQNCRACCREKMRKRRAQPVQVRTEQTTVIRLEPPAQ